MILCKIDPENKYAHHSKQRIFDSCGLIPGWITALDITKPVKQQIEDMYGFGKLYEMTGGEVLLNGAYVYPEDPMLYPLVAWKFEINNVLTEIFMYEYAMLTIRVDGVVFTTRVDQ